MVVFADKSREEELIDIWKQSFGDSEEYIRMFFAWNISKTMVIIYETDGRAVSVAYLLPITYREIGKREFPCWYLYAAATLPAYRGHGYFGEIMKTVHEKIKEPVILVPGEPSLIDYYKKHGLHMWQEEVFQEIMYDTQNMTSVLDDVSFDIKDISAQEYALKRNQLLSESGYIIWDDHFMEYICHENKFCGGDQKEICVNGKEYIVMYRKEEDVLRILEVLPQEDICVQALLKETGLKKANVCICPNVMTTDKDKLSQNQGYFNLTMG